MLGYQQHGLAEGAPLFFFHGSPGSRRAWELFAGNGLAEELRIRAVVADRPGIGLSSQQRRRKLLDWPADVAALADHLGIGRFAALGYSGGGPYAAACVLAMPERMARVGIVSGTAPFDVPGVTDPIRPMNLRLLQWSRKHPRCFQMALRLAGLGARYTPRLAARVTMLAVAEPDRRLLAQPKFRDAFMAMTREALRQGPEGTQRDLALMVSPWGFDPGEIRTPVWLWHGEADENAPVAMGRYLAAVIQDAVLTVVPDEGHLSLLAKYAPDILCALTR